MIDSKTLCKRPHVAVQAIINKDGKFLVGKRIGGNGSGTWSFPGGKLELGEELLECARREVLEEVGIKIKNLILGPYVNNYYEKTKSHYVVIFVLADYASGEVRVMEPDKCLEWRWVEWNKIPKPWFLPIKNLRKQGFDPRKN